MIDFRDTRATDAAFLKSVLQTIWHDTYDSFLGAERVTSLTSSWHTLEKLRQEAKSDAICSLVARANGEIIGHVLAYEAEPRRIHVARLYVAHKYHGQGIGKRLLDKAIAVYANPSAIYLEVYEVNERAVGFYKSQGFHVTERIRDAYAENELYEFRMEKRLVL